MKAPVDYIRRLELVVKRDLYPLELNDVIRIAQWLEENPDYRQALTLKRKPA